MNIHAVIWRTGTEVAGVLAASFGEAKTWGEALETARAWLMVVVLWSGFQAMKIAAMPVQM
ncbi:MAG TPA: hypothetical protein VK801_11165 [Caulobacteraceae bacterium]|jgi:hypothetical protein|nr:hypothetical protein [Caulobacteraceae bacterium]